jgi:hypothetical protein
LASLLNENVERKNDDENFENDIYERHWQDFLPGLLLTSSMKCGQSLGKKTNLIFYPTLKWKVSHQYQSYMLLVVPPINKRVLVN